MITRGMLKEYLKYIVPTMITFTLGGVYSIIDGVFVGHAVGDAGLAGINVAFPLVAFIMAVGTGVGMGGGVISSIARGAGDAGAGGGVHGRHRLGRPVPDPRDRLHAAYPQPGESGLRDGRAGVRRLDERGA